MRLALGLVAILACAGIAWGARLHNRYMIARMLSLFTVSVAAAGAPDRLIENVRKRPKLFIALMVLASLGLIVALFADELIRLLAYWAGNPNAPTPFR